MPGFASRPPDMKALIIDVLSEVELTRSVKPNLEAPYRCLVVRAELQNRVTPISRYCRVGVEAWSVREDGTADPGDAFDLAAEAAETLELSPGTRRIILSAETQSGPADVIDEISRIEFQYVTVLLEVAV